MIKKQLNIINLYDLSKLNKLIIDLKEQFNNLKIFLKKINFEKYQKFLVKKEIYSKSILMYVIRHEKNLLKYNKLNKLIIYNYK